MDKGADLTIKNVNGLTAYTQAIKADEIDLFQILYEDCSAYEKGDKFQKERKFQRHIGMIHGAASSAGSECLAYIIKKAMHRDKNNLMNQQNNTIDQATPLMFAVLAKNQENCKLILQNLDKGSKKGNDGRITHGPNAQD